MSNFWQRVLTGIIFVIAVIGGLWWNEFSYLLIFLTVVIFGMLEFVELLKLRKPVSAQVGWALFIGCYWYLTVFFVLRDNISPLWLMFLVPLLIAVFITELYRKSETPLLNIAVTLLVPSYIALPFSFLHYLAFYGQSHYEFSLLMGFFALVWANDTGAYLVGVTMGKHKLFPRISPKKTWEGLIGGFVFTLVAASIIVVFFKDLSFVTWLVIASIVSVMGSLGDLVESMLKRSVHVKDSGFILPGHGGVLDRFDAVIFAAPLMVSYLILLHFLA
jgi:phosphatidate cytidylyltransferase